MGVFSEQAEKQRESERPGRAEKGPREAGGGGSRGLRCILASKAVCSDPKDITWQTLGRGAGSPAVGLGGTAGKPWVSQNQVNQHGLRPQGRPGVLPRAPGPIRAAQCALNVAINPPSPGKQGSLVHPPPDGCSFEWDDGFNRLKAVGLGGPARINITSGHPGIGRNPAGQRCRRGGWEGGVWGLSPAEWMHNLLIACGGGGGGDGTLRRL